MSKFFKKHKEIVFLSDFESEFARRSAFVINTFTSHHAEVFSLEDIKKLPQVHINNIIRSCWHLAVCTNKFFGNSWQTFFINRPYIQIIDKKVPAQQLQNFPDSVLLLTSNKELEEECLYIPMIPTDLFPYVDDAESMVYYHPEIVRIWKEIID